MTRPVSLPIKNGFRQRGSEMTRLETFTDAAFAFAVTLLVILVDEIPRNYDDLVAAMRGVPAFAASFATMMIFWAAHYRWSRRFGLEDVPAVLLSLALVFTVLVYVYPLRMLFAALFDWLSGGALADDFYIGSVSGIRMMFAFYGIGFATLASLIALLHGHALRRGGLLGLDAYERYETRAEVIAWLIVAAVGLLAILLALLLPPALVGYSGFSYMLLPIVMPLFGYLSDRRRPPVPVS